MKILVPVDNTAVSTKAVQYALEDASDSDEVIFTHCVTDNVSVTEGTFSVDLDKAQELGDRAIENAQQIAEGYDVSTDAIRLRTERVVDGILQATEEYTPDKICLGHRHQHHSYSSVAKRLIGKSPVPVTVISQETNNG